MGFLRTLLGEEPDLFERLTHYKDKGQYGEYLTEYALEHNLVPKGRFELLKNLYLPADGKTTEIDQVMIHHRGIFVVESKNYSGWIFGDEEGLYWTQSLKGNVRNRFYNPIRQNANHIKYLAKYLSELKLHFDLNDTEIRDIIKDTYISKTSFYKLIKKLERFFQKK